MQRRDCSQESAGIYPQQRLKKYWLVADSHLGHSNLLKESYGARPKDFEERLIRSIKASVGIGDVLIHLGDVCMGQEASWHYNITSATAAKKWLVLGNHDKKSVVWYLEHGWDFAGESLTLDLFSKIILFSHKPQPWVDQFDINIHGHWHANDHRASEFFEDGKHILIAVENTNYQVVNLRKMVEGFSPQQKKQQQ
jgi:calcineurin-like phosphoesterase family protein